MSSGEPVRLAREQVRRIDQLAVERYHIPGIVLMENAARAVTDVALDLLKQLPCEVAKIGVLCGGGNNGGDGLAVARHLANHGHDVWLGMMTDPLKYRGDAATNWQIATAMRFFAPPSSDPNFDFCVTSSDLIIDGLFGTGLESPPRNPDQIDMINELAARILAIDLPSGMNCDTGEPMGTCIRAERTVTFVAEKAGFANPASKQYTGEVTVGDIGCPRELVDEVARMSTS